MAIVVQAKSALANILYYLRITAARLKRMPQCGYILLMYHRIAPNDGVGAYIQPGMYVSPATFALHLRFLRKHFAIVPLHELSCSLRGGWGSRYEKPPCALTFDDGWYDFYKYAYPVLTAYKLPATVFLPTDFIGTHRWFWTDRLAYLLTQKESLERRRVGASAPLFTNPLCAMIERLKGSMACRIEHAIHLLKQYRNEEIEEAISTYACSWQLEDKPPGRAFLSWEEICKMMQSGYISFGSHTAGHRILTTLTYEEIRYELAASKQRLISEGVAGHSHISFCYPDGGYDSSIAAMVKDAGYYMAVTTDRGWNLPYMDPFMLRRIPIHQDMASSEAMLACRILGLF